MSTKIASAEKYFTLEEYLDLEEQAVVKHEFDNGKTIEMSGLNLNRIALQLKL